MARIPDGTPYLDDAPTARPWLQAVLDSVPDGSAAQYAIIQAWQAAGSYYYRPTLYDADNPLRQAIEGNIPEASFVAWRQQHGETQAVASTLFRILPGAFRVISGESGVAVPSLPAANESAGAPSFARLRVIRQVPNYLGGMYLNSSKISLGWDNPGGVTGVISGRPLAGAPGSFAPIESSGEEVDIPIDLGAGQWEFQIVPVGPVDGRYDAPVVARWNVDGRAIGADAFVIPPAVIPTAPPTTSGGIRPAPSDPTMPDGVPTISDGFPITDGKPGRPVDSPVVDIVAAVRGGGSGGTSKLADTPNGAPSGGAQPLPPVTVTASAGGGVPLWAIGLAVVALAFLFWPKGK